MIKHSLQTLLKKHNTVLVLILNDLLEATMKEPVEQILKQKYFVKSAEMPKTAGEVADFFLHGEHLNSFTQYFRVKKLLKDSRYPNVCVWEGEKITSEVWGMIKELDIPVKVAVIDDSVDEESMQSVAKYLRKDAWLLLNSDKKIIRFQQETSAQVLTYGLSEKAQLRVEEMRIKQQVVGDSLELTGMQGHVRQQGKVVPMLVAGLLGKEAIYAALAGLACGLGFGLPLLEMLNTLRQLQPAGGRLRILPGIKNTIIIDDSYGENLKSSLESLEVLRDIQVPPNKKKIAVIPECSDLMPNDTNGYQQLAQQIMEANINALILVGPGIKPLQDLVVAKGMNSSQVFYKETSEEAGHFTQDLMKKGDVVYVDGQAQQKSELIVKEIMAEPLKANALLARTHEEWKI